MQTSVAVACLTLTYVALTSVGFDGVNKESGRSMSCSIRGCLRKMSALSWKARIVRSDRVMKTVVTRDYGWAGTFYFGEMEQKWKGNGGLLATLYRWSSSYGHSPGQAFAVLLLLLVVDAWLVASCGLKPASGAVYNLAEGNEGLMWGSAWWNAFWFHVVKVVTFNQPVVVPKLPLGDVISTLMRIGISVQVALFVLAVNRKFKR